MPTPTSQRPSCSLGAIHLGSGRLGEAVRRFAATIRPNPSYLPAPIATRSRAASNGAKLYDAALVEYIQCTCSCGSPCWRKPDWGMPWHWRTRRAGDRRGPGFKEGRRTYPDQPEFTELLVRLLAAAPDGNVRDGAQAVALARALVEQSRSWRTLEALAMALAESGHFSEAVGASTGSHRRLSPPNGTIECRNGRHAAGVRTSRAVPGPMGGGSG